ncbi:Hpt domain-containing protein, partial [Ralstonia sp. UBA689]|uniref:Hpt domain-containing protein n=1 Tax=Ralstonia sp. UBA689 TaxID=1947373 RepID=UPI0025EBB0F9
EMLGHALKNRDIGQARHAAHRIAGAAAVVRQMRTRDLAAELERRFSAPDGGVATDAEALFAELQSLNQADTTDHSGDEGGVMRAQG